MKKRGDDCVKADVLHLVVVRHSGYRSDVLICGTAKNGCVVYAGFVFYILWIGRMTPQLLRVANKIRSQSLHGIASAAHSVVPIGVRHLNALQMLEEQLLMIPILHEFGFAHVCDERIDLFPR